MTSKTAKLAAKQIERCVEYLLPRNDDFTKLRLVFEKNSKSDEDARILYACMLIVQNTLAFHCSGYVVQAKKVKK